MFRNSINEFIQTEESLLTGAGQVAKYLHAIATKNKLSADDAKFIRQCRDAYLTIAYSAPALLEKLDAANSNDLDQNEIATIFQNLNNSLVDETKNEAFLTLVTACSLVAKNYSTLFKVLEKLPNPNQENMKSSDAHFTIKLKMIKPVQYLPQMIIMSHEWEKKLEKHEDIDGNTLPLIQATLASINRKFLRLAKKIDYIVQISLNNDGSTISKIFAMFGFQSSFDMTQSGIHSELKGDLLQSVIAQSQAENANSLLLLQDTLQNTQEEPAMDEDFYLQLNQLTDSMVLIPEIPERDPTMPTYAPPVWDEALLDQSVIKKKTSIDFDYYDKLLAELEDESKLENSDTDSDSEYEKKTKHIQVDRPIEDLMNSLIRSSEKDLGVGVGIDSDSEEEENLGKSSIPNLSSKDNQAEIDKLMNELGKKSNDVHPTVPTTDLPQNNLPDNALRMNQLLNKYRIGTEASDQPYRNVTELLLEEEMQRINKTYVESAREDARNIYIRDLFNNLDKNLYTPDQREALHFASLSNQQLLDMAETCETEKFQKKYYREIAGRLLRSDKNKGITLDIETKLFAEVEKDGLIRRQYPNTLNAIFKNFAKQNNKVYDLYFSRKDDRKGSEKSGTLNTIFEGWKTVTLNDNHNYDYLLTMRDQFLNLQQNLQRPEVQDALKKDRESLNSGFLAALVALGCIVLPVIGWLVTGIAMYRSYKTKGTVLFTHAPDSMKITPATEKSLIKLGRA